MAATLPSPAPGGDYVLATSALMANVGGESVAGMAGQATARVQRKLPFTMWFVDDPVSPGEPVTVRYTLENQSASTPATSIAFAHNLGQTLTGLAATGLPIADPCGAGPQIGAGGGGLQLSGGTLAAGAVAPNDLFHSIACHTGICPRDLPADDVRPSLREGDRTEGIEVRCVPGSAGLGS